MMQTHERNALPTKPLVDGLVSRRRRCGAQHIPQDSQHPSGVGGSGGSPL